jgi:hypothetical protein
MLGTQDFGRVAGNMSAGYDKEILDFSAVNDIVKCCFVEQEL